MTDSRRLQLGLFVAGSGVLLAVLAIFFGGSPRMFQTRKHFTIVFDDAPGVVIGTPVRKSGVRIGEVESVFLDDDKGVVKVLIGIDPQYSLRANEEPQIAQDLLSRDVTIDFLPLLPPKTKPPPPPQSKAGVVAAQFVLLQAGPEPPPAASNRVLPPNSVIRGRSPLDPRRLLGVAEGLLPSAEQSLAQIRSSVQRFERVAPIVEDTLREYAELAKSVRDVVPDVRRTNDDLRAILAKVKGLEPEVVKTLDEAQDAIRQFKRTGERVDVILQTNQAEIDRAIRNVAEVSQRIVALLNDENQRNFNSSLKSVQTATKSFETLSKSLEELANTARTKTLPQFSDTLAKVDGVMLNVGQITKPFADRADRISRNLDTSIDQIARTIGGLSDAFAGFGKGDGSIQKLFSDPSLFNNLNDASLMLTRVLPRVDRILRDFEVFADKIARHPETIGVGGAVRPSAGLKEPIPVSGSGYRP